MLYALVDFVLSYINTDFTKKLVRMSIFVLFAIIGWLCMLTGHALRGMDRVFTVYPLIEIGHFFREYNIMNRLKGFQKVLTVLLSLIVLTIGYQFGNIALVNNEIVNPVFFLLMSIAGWFGLWIIATVVVRFEYSKILFELFSKRAVWIIGGHFLAFKIVTLVQIITMKIEFKNLATFPVCISGLGWSTFYTLVGLGCPLLIYFLYDKFVQKVRMVKLIK